MKVKRLTPTAILPKRAHSTDAGMDLYADSDKVISIPAHSAKMIGTGIAIALEEGYFGGVYPRSGLASKKGLRPSNCTGVIDSEYRGEVKVSLHNDTDFVQEIEPYERIAQLIIQPCSLEDVEEVDELDETDRGTGGFGSSGKH